MSPPPDPSRRPEYRVWGVLASVVAVLVGFVWVSVYVLSGAQSYIRAEGLYVKSMLETAHKVERYAETGAAADLGQARAALATPAGYDQVRRLLLADPSDPGGQARALFHEAGHSWTEADRLSVLFPVLRTASALRPAYLAWVEAEALTRQLGTVISDVERAVAVHGPGSPEARRVANQAAQVTDAVLPLGRRFSATIERGTERVRWALVVGALALGLALAWVSGIYAVRFLRRLRAADQQARAHAEQLAQASDRARREAEEHLRLKTSLLHNMSHEIRTPLTAILGFAEILAEGLAAEERDLALGVLRGGQRLRRTLDSVLEHAQLEAGHVRIERADVDVTAEVAEAVGVLQPLADAKGLALVGPSADAIAAHLDARALGRIVTHLVGNAIKFTEVGTVEVSVAESASGDEVAVSVSDTGVGMSAADAARVFDAFAQVSEGIGRRHEGNGLGLAITERLATLMGGRIHVESTPGAGTTVRVWLPTGRQPGPGMGDGIHAGARAGLAWGGAPAALGHQRRHRPHLGHAAAEAGAAERESV